MPDPNIYYRTFIFSVIGFCGCIAGILGMWLGSGAPLKLGGVSLHGLIAGTFGGAKSVIAALSGGLVVCTGEAVLAKFAQGYFENELKAGTPFTVAGAKELLRLGILTAAVPTGCAIVGSIVEGIAAGFLKTEKAAAELHIDDEASIVLGIMFLFGALLCRYGAELRDGSPEKPGA